MFVILLNLVKLSSMMKLEKSCSFFLKVEKIVMFSVRFFRLLCCWNRYLCLFSIFL